jgi:phosphatidylglycerophosphate synthase
MNWKLPNQLTLARIVLAAAFFVVLSLYSQGKNWSPWLLNAALVLYVVAGITDGIDGYLARKMNVVSAFGRIADPLVDKVLVVGAFAMLAGGNFDEVEELASPFEHGLPHWLTGGMVSAVQGWMVVAIIAREFVISAVRGYIESCGTKFPAGPAGKVKMFVQSLAISVVLFQLANLPQASWAILVKIAMVWLAVVATILSGLAYVAKASKVLISHEPRA